MRKYDDFIVLCAMMKEFYIYCYVFFFVFFVFFVFFFCFFVFCFYLNHSLSMLG
jgi:hypothetical protein